MLERLRNGHWVDQDLVTAIKPFPAEHGLPPRVVVTCWTGESAQQSCCDFETLAEAQSWADDFASRCNAARLSKQPNEV